MKPRLLFVSPRFLFPTDQGGKIRTANILRRMKGGAFEIVLASPAPEDAAAFAADTDGACDRFAAWPARAAGRLDRLRALPGALPVAVATDRSAAGRELVAAELARRPAAVVIDFPHAAVLLPDRVDAASLLFTHNVEAEIFERHVRVARFPMRAVWQGQARRMRDFEGAALRRFDRAIAVSARDADVLARDYGIPRPEVIDTGVDLDFFPYTPPPAAGDARGGTIVFTGAMDWRANIDGIEFLMQQVWPLVLARRPAARVVVVGRNPPEALVARAPGESWRFTGFVDDIRPHVAAAQLYVIPLRVGSGTRIKAFEAMAMGRPVVSTPVGVEGLDVQPGEHYLAAGADDPAAFAAAILRLLDDPGLAARLAEAARRRVEERFSWSHVARQFEAICLRAVASRANPG